MLSNEPVRNPADYVVQYEVVFMEDSADTELVKGRKVKSDSLVSLLWKLIPAVYLQMKSRKESNWNDLASCLKDELSERISMDAFWMGQLYAERKYEAHADKKIEIHAMIMDSDHMDFVFTSSNGLSARDFMEGISSVIQKTYSILLVEDSASAEWMKYSLTFLIKKESFWNEGTVTDEQTEELRKEFYKRSQRFS